MRGMEIIVGVDLRQDEVMECADVKARNSWAACGPALMQTATIFPLFFPFSFWRPFAFSLPRFFFAGFLLSLSRLTLFALASSVGGSLELGPREPAAASLPLLFCLGFHKQSFRGRGWRLWNRGSFCSFVFLVRFRGAVLTMCKLMCGGGERGPSRLDSQLFY